MSSPSKPPPSDPSRTIPRTKPRRSVRRESAGERALFLLLAVLAATVAVEVVLVDYLFLGPGWSDVAPDDRGDAVGDGGADGRDRTGGAYSGGADAGAEEASEGAEEAAAGAGAAAPAAAYPPPRPPPPRSLESILTEAGVRVTPDVRARLPPMSEPIGLYGPDPVVVGLDTCDAYRGEVKAEDAFIAVAGMFNTGTNLLTELLVRNCFIPEKVRKLGSKRIGMRGQVPWGKHTPASWRGAHRATDQRDIPDHSSVLPAVVVKDPYTWMASMCRHKYAANWVRVEGHCPNLVPVLPRERDDPRVRGRGGGESVPVTVRYGDDNSTHHASLAHLWNDWYRPWVDAAHPRVILRFEDLLLRPAETVTAVCRCGGGVMRGGGFRYVASNAKGDDPAHRGSSSMTGALVRYTNATLRLEPFMDEDLRYARTALDGDLMERFGYRYGERRPGLPRRAARLG